MNEVVRVVMALEKNQRERWVTCVKDVVGVVMALEKN